MSTGSKKRSKPKSRPKSFPLRLYSNDNKQTESKQNEMKQNHTKKKLRHRTVGLDGQHDASKALYVSLFR